VKGFDCEEEEDVEGSAALPHAVTSVGAPSMYCFGGERSEYFLSGAEESKGGNGEEEKDCDEATTLPHAVAPVVAPSLSSWGGAEKRKGFDGDAAATFAHAVAHVGAPSTAATGLRRVARLKLTELLRAAASVP